MSDTDRLPTEPATPDELVKKYAAMMDKVRQAAGEMNARMQRLSGEFDIPLPVPPDSDQDQ